jgi:aminoglycoside phosphotransferase family enzyme
MLCFRPHRFQDIQKTDRNEPFRALTFLLALQAYVCAKIEDCVFSSEENSE